EPLQAPIPVSKEPAAVRATLSVAKPRDTRVSHESGYRLRPAHGAAFGAVVVLLILALAFAFRNSDHGSSVPTTPQSPQDVAKSVFKSTVLLTLTDAGGKNAKIGS